MINSKLLFLLSFFYNINLSKQESNLKNRKIDKLRHKLFNDYDKTTRPVINFSDSVNLEYGIEIKSLEYFDQKAENIKFNLWITQLWNDEYLSWNKSEYNFEYITINSFDVWIPDLELYNAASGPKIYDTKGGMKLYSNGNILWVRPTTYSFACQLKLDNFPFDEQSCTMTFGSWKYNSNFLNLKPFQTSKYKNISVDPTFSHNEWNIINTYVNHEEYEYLCCPGELWPNSMYTINLKRSYVKYMVVIAMTLLLTIAAMILLLFPITEYRRTFVLVFIPLTIIWLQIYISSKIPVIEYYTTMEQILLVCFLVTISSAFESSILYCLISERFDILKKFYKINKIKAPKLKNNMVIIRKPLQNLDLYNKLLKHILLFDKLFIVFIYLGFIISITVLLI